MKINYNKEIYDGWTIKKFIHELEPSLNLIMTGQSWKKPFKTKKELKTWCMENQPYYKKHIPEVTEHFAKYYNLH